MNQLLSKTPDASFGAAAVTFTYNHGRRATMTDASGTTGYSYSAENLQQVNKPAGQLNYSYDLADNVTQLSGGGMTVNYTYDALNRLSTVQEGNTGTTTYGYDNVGNLQSVTYPNGVVHGYSYDARNRLTNLGVAKRTNNLASYGYTLDAAGHRTSVAELSGRTVNYTYDNLYRLTNETVSADPSAINGAVTYIYDPVGNRKQMTSTLPAVAAGLFNYNANDELTSDVYDANGNTTTSGGLNYVYDFENHLIQKGGLSIVYDGDGNRVSKTVAGVKTLYLVDTLNPTGYAQVIAEEAQNTAPTVPYVYGLERISQRRTVVINGTFTTQIRYFDYDGHGSVRGLTDESGNVTDTYDYDAFGVLIHSTGTTQNVYLYSGEQFDPDLNLYYNRARYLNVSTGRFWTMDTDEGDSYDPVSLHKYLYGQANPVGSVDPTGHEIEGEILGASEQQYIGAREQAATLRIYQTAFRTALYAGQELIYQTPTLLLRAAAALTAVVVAASSVISALEQTPSELPDVAASQVNNSTDTLLFRDTDGTAPSSFRWRGFVAEPDGLSFFEQPFMNPKTKPFSVGFKARYVGLHQAGALGGFTEPELYGIGVVFTPQLAGGQDHWSCPVTEESAQSYAERFAKAAKRIKEEGLNFLPNPNR